LNETMKYFKEQDSFSLDEFSEKVILQPEVMESFSRYKQEYEQDRDIRIEDEFAISDLAVKKQARSYKSVIKLDRNFHIYVHGNRSLLEQGEDEKGKFYKVYYEEEE
ncbi:MAG: nucleoid-associated protein, partial [Alistipes finegoldii]